MSAWYVFSAMGFYPVDPVSGEYELGMPLFDEVTIELPDGETFTVLCRFEQSKPTADTYLNGKRVEGTTITHRDITGGGILEFK